MQASISYDCSSLGDTASADGETSILRKALNLWYQISYFYKQQYFFDVEVEAEGKRFSAHKIVLLANSEYFRALFRHTLSTNTIYVSELTADAFEIALDYMYTAKLKFEESNDNFDMFGLMKAASFLQIDGMMSDCCQLLSHMLTSENCLTVWQLGRQFDSRWLELKAVSFIRQNFDLVLAANPVCLSLSATDIEAIVADDTLQIRSEELLLSWVIRWAEVHSEIQKPTLVRVLRHVRLHLIKNIDEALKDCSQSVTDAVNDALLELKADKCRLLRGPRLGGDWGLFAFGGKRCLEDFADDGVDIDDDDDKSYLPPYVEDNREFFSPISSWKPTNGIPTVGFATWRHVSRLPSKQRSSFGLAKWDSYVYITGGEDAEGLIYPTTVLYDHSERVCRPLPDLTVPRSRHAMLACENGVYVLGGFCETGWTDSIEVFNPLRRTWDLLPFRMPYKLSAFGAIFHRERAYVCGGINDYERPVDTFFEWIVDTDEWYPLPSLPQPRSNMAIAAHETYLLIVGGLNSRLPGCGASRSILSYDVEMLQWTAVWLHLERPVTRCSACIVRERFDDDEIDTSARCLNVGNRQALLVVSARPRLIQVVWLSDGRVDILNHNLLMEDGGLTTLLDTCYS